MTDSDQNDTRPTSPLEHLVRPAVWVEPGHLKEQQTLATKAGYGVPVITGTDKAEGKVPLYAIPKGWRLVPEVPTPEMHRAVSELQGYVGFAEKWRAAVAAAPQHDA